MPLARFKCSEDRDRHPHILPIGFGCAPCLCLQYFDERHLSGEHLVQIEAVGADQIGLPAAGRPRKTPAAPLRMELADLDQSRRELPSPLGAKERPMRRYRLCLAALEAVQEGWLEEFRYVELYREKAVGVIDLGAG
jgi:hypothetical protein